MLERWSVVALCGLVVLAGCSGGTLGTSSNGPPLSEIQYPDGASADGIHTPKKILESTGEHSEKTDYRSTLNSTTVYSDGTTEGFQIEKRASLESRAAKYELVIDPRDSSEKGFQQFVSENNGSVSIYEKNTNENGGVNFKRGTPVDAPYRTNGHSLFSKPPVKGWVYYSGFLGIDNLTATGTTVVENESAIVYELANPGSPDEIGIETLQIIIGTDGTMYRLHVKTQFPESGGGMRTKYIHFSYDPQDVDVETPSWLDKAK
jgi:hypothetical protein